MYNCIICRYHEIATKGNNRNMFEKCLVDNIRRLLDGMDVKVRRVRGRVWVEPSEARDLSEAELAQAERGLGKAFGLESFSPAIRMEADMETIRKTALELTPALIREKFAQKGVFPFRIRARRSNKRFPFTSKEIEIDLITRIAEAVGPNQFKIDLDRADLTLGCEVRDEFALLFFDTLPAPGGLPVGCNPRVLTLLSGGIDSPVAAWLIMKRGSPSDFVTFHSSPYTPPETTEKVMEVAVKLNEYQRSGTLYMVNLAPFQKQVRDLCREKFRTVLYRRAMLRIAEIIARRGCCMALNTGEALGQVASQTVPNMHTINRAVEMLVLRPLVGADKLDAIEAAERIGTMEISRRQVPDSCTVFAPSAPATNVPVELAEAEEAKIPGYRALLEELAAAAEIAPEQVQ